MPTLHDQFDEAAGDSDLDLDRLTRVARQRGTRQKRARAAMTTFGTAAAALVVGGTGWALWPTEAPSPNPPPATSPASSPLTQTPPTDTTVSEHPITGRETVALAIDAAQQVVPGRVAPQSIAGQDGDGAPYAEFLDTVAGVTSKIGVNVQYLSLMEVSHDCAGRAHCEAFTAGRGRRVLLYDRSDKPGVIDRVVELQDTGTDLRLMLASTPDAQGAHALTHEQLRAIAEDPRWSVLAGPDLVELAAGLPAYRDLDAVAGN